MTAQGSPGELLLWPWADQSCPWGLGRPLELVRFRAPLGGPQIPCLSSVQSWGTCVQRPCLSAPGGLMPWCSWGHAFPQVPSPLGLLPASPWEPPSAAGHPGPREPPPAGCASSSGSAVEAFGAGAFASQLSALGTGPGKPAAGWLSPRVLTADLFLHLRFQVCDGGCSLSCGC